MTHMDVGNAASRQEWLLRPNGASKASRLKPPLQQPRLNPTTATDNPHQGHRRQGTPHELDHSPRLAGQFACPAGRRTHPPGTGPFRFLAAVTAVAGAVLPGLA